MRVQFKQAKQTPGAVRFEEVDASGRPLRQSDFGCKIGTLYVRKTAFPDGKFPSDITVTIE